jgi:hypothetical protein
LTIGVGEAVDVTFSNGNALWTATAGTFLIIPPASASTNQWTAPDTAQTVIVTAISPSDSSHASITFSVIAPGTVAGTRTSEPIDHTHNEPDIGMYINFYIGPDTVNFYAVQTLEEDAPATANGCYSCFDGHSHHPGTEPNTFNGGVVAGKGTLCDNHTDHCYSGYCVGITPPFTPGSETFNIPSIYSVDGFTWYTITNNAVQVATLAADQSTLTMTKAGASATCQVTDPTSP